MYALIHFPDRFVFFPSVLAHCRGDLDQNHSASSDVDDLSSVLVLLYNHRHSLERGEVRHSGEFGASVIFALLIRALISATGPFSEEISHSIFTNVTPQRSVDLVFEPLEVSFLAMKLVRLEVSFRCRLRRTR